MLLSNDNDIYYVVSYEGQCTIKKISSTDDSEHHNVLDIKSNNCLAFANEGNFFYFIDDFKNVMKIQKQKDSD